MNCTHQVTRHQNTPTTPTARCAFGVSRSTGTPSCARALTRTATPATANAASTGAGGTARLARSIFPSPLPWKNRRANVHAYAARSARFPTFAHTSPASPIPRPRASPAAAATKSAEQTRIQRAWARRSAGAMWAVGLGPGPGRLLHLARQQDSSARSPGPSAHPHRPRPRSQTPSAHPHRHRHRQLHHQRRSRRRCRAR